MEKSPENGHRVAQSTEAHPEQPTERRAPEVSGVRHTLVVDDNEAVCEVLQQALAETGSIVTSAHNSAEARRVLNEGVTDVVLVDVHLSGESGLSLAEYAHAMGAAVIVMSGHPDAMAAVDQPAHHRLGKPFRVPELITAVDEAIARRNGGARV